MYEWEIILIVIGTLLMAAAILFLIFVGKLEVFYTRLNKLVDDLNAQIKQRYAVIPEILKEVCGVAPQSPLVLRIESLRNNALKATRKQDILRINQKLTIALSKLVFLAEEFPELRKNEQYEIFWAQLSAGANNIYHFKQEINDLILQHNYFLDRILFMPFVKLLRLKKREFFVLFPEETPQDTKKESDKKGSSK